MDNQHRLSKGYRDLSQTEIDLMNEIKAKGAELEALCDKVWLHLKGQYDAAAPGKACPDQERDRLDRANPLLWEFNGRTNFKLALMQLTRAVAQPTDF